MITQKSPGGSIFPYPYKGGELFGAHFGSFFADEERLLHLMHAEEQFMLEMHRALPYWVDFYETRLTDRVLTEFAGFVNRLQKLIPKLAIVGCSGRDRRRLVKLAKKAGINFPMPVRFFEDPEVAKSWLMGEAE